VGRQINEFSRDYKISNIGIYISRLGGGKSEPEKLEANFAKFTKAQRSGRPYTLGECKLEEQCKARSFRASNAKLQAAAIQQRFYSVAFVLKSCLAEKSRTAPKKGTKTHPAFASGTTGTCWFL